MYDTVVNITNIKTIIVVVNFAVTVSGGNRDEEGYDREARRNAHEDD